jgi:hypothetical protein
MDIKTLLFFKFGKNENRLRFNIFGLFEIGKIKQLIVGLYLKILSINSSSESKVHPTVLVLDYQLDMKGFRRDEIWLSRY